VFPLLEMQPKRVCLASSLLLTMDVSGDSRTKQARRHLQNYKYELQFSLRCSPTCIVLQHFDGSAMQMFLVMRIRLGYIPV
jgi:hypothetical protein